MPKIKLTATQSVEGLAKTLDTRLQEFSAKLTQLETMFSERLAGTEKSVENLKTQLGKTESGLKNALGSLKTIDTAKVDKKDQESLANQVAALSTQMTARDNDMSERLSDLTAVTQKQVNDLLKLRTEITALTDSKIDRKTLQQELENQQQKLYGALQRSGQKDIRHPERPPQTRKRSPADASVLSSLVRPGTLAAAVGSSKKTWNK